MTRIALLFALAACLQPAPEKPTTEAVVPLSCGSRGCSTSSECGNVNSACNHCFGGVCSAVLPADPKPDAGIDAPGGTTP